ncbi:helix-turn-helix domain-containing protein [Aquimarina sp. 2201CG5-10]|uniref:helix-turn-helix domain-containing protein n=1 Tax=Aquimarina callyspongiae TaxID=3098150 RepID=UPI002AB49892|nr:helix-turn-helix domain-containing protein [Aquimarina sp. 2201CG5-10]MDY8137462.1 helix-turn-helix domain-containing protein [Aquimarina sp. 2201CG5-10]
MKQPQLGKKISELRLAKGLTQTELAEKCNISLRTIQRIESTEVTPRSYTLKLIFKVLDFDGFSSSNKNSSIRSENSNNSRKNLVRTILLLLTTSIVSILISKLVSNSNKQSTKEVTEIIHNNQSNIKRWMNNKQVDSVLTIYDDNACILNSVCGKIQIRQMMINVVNNNYELIEYNSISLNVSDNIAVEKYKNTYRYKGKVSNQVGITEWHFQNGKWLITNDVFHD